MKMPLVLTALMLSLATIACSMDINLPEIKDAGPTQTVEVSEALPDDPDVGISVYMEMGAGKLALSGGADKLAEGTVKTNVEQWIPKVTRTTDELRIVQNTSATLSIAQNIVNEWDIKLNDDVVMDMQVHAGAYQGDYNLSGLHLRNLEIADGASDTKVAFDTPNPEKMERFRYSTGASKVSLTGLANANFDEMDFESGAGDYTLDFNGNLQRNATVRIHTGVSQITLVVPDGIKAEITVYGELNNVSLDGAWEVNDNVYSTAGDGPLLSIEVNMGVGSLQLTHEKPS